MKKLSQNGNEIRTSLTSKMNKIFMRAIAIALLIVFLAISATFTYADSIDKQPEACNQNENIGTVFYNFRTLYIWYAYYPSIDIQKKHEFPEPLKFINFNRRLLAAIRKNFGNCLKNADGSEKPIIIIPTIDELSSQPHLEKILNEKVQPESGVIHDPKDLTIFVDVSYGLSHKNLLASVFMFFYRPDVSYKPARLPLGNNSLRTSFVLNNANNEIPTGLANLFSRIAPVKALLHPPGDDGNDVDDSNVIIMRDK